MADAAARVGEHPYDQELAGSWLWHWILPSLRLLLQHWQRILPFAVAYGIYIWLLPHLLLASPFKPNRMLEILDAVQVAVVSTALMAFGYARLAQAEGSPYGVGYLPAPKGIAQRLALVALFWMAFSALLGWLLRGVLSLLMKSSGFMQAGLWLFSKLEWWSIPFLLWLFAPFWAWLMTVSALTQIRAIRGEEPIGELLIDSFRRVHADLLRLALPSWAIAAAVLLPVWLFIEQVMGGVLVFFMRTGWGGVIGVTALSMALALPYLFVLERVYLPELGIEEDLESVAQESPAAAAPQVSLVEQLDQVRAQDGEAAAARKLANWIRARQAPQAELAPLLQRIGDPALVARELGAVAIEWAQGSRQGELVWLVGAGLALSPLFLMDQPDKVVGLAKKLTQIEQVSLATRLLLAFLKQCRGHPDHLPAGLQLARVLATHSNNLAGARKLLGQLAEIYPDDPQPAQLLKQLGS